MQLSRGRRYLLFFTGLALFAPTLPGSTDGPKSVLALRRGLLSVADSIPRGKITDEGLPEETAGLSRSQVERLLGRPEKTFLVPTILPPGSPRYERWIYGPFTFDIDRGSIGSVEFNPNGQAVRVQGARYNPRHRNLVDSASSRELVRRILDIKDVAQWSRCWDPRVTTRLVAAASKVSSANVKAVLDDLLSAQMDCYSGRNDFSGSLELDAAFEALLLPNQELESKATVWRGACFLLRSSLINSQPRSLEELEADLGTRAVRRLPTEQPLTRVELMRSLSRGLLFVDNTARAEYEIHLMRQILTFRGDLDDLSAVGRRSHSLDPSEIRERWQRATAAESAVR